MKKPNKESQQMYKQRKTEEGFSRLNVWVPTEYKKELMSIIEEMRAEHKAKK